MPFVPISDNITAIGVINQVQAGSNPQFLFKVLHLLQEIRGNEQVCQGCDPVFESQSLSVFQAQTQAFSLIK